MVLHNSNPNTTYSFHTTLNEIPNEIRMEVEQLQIPTPNHTYANDLLQFKEECDKLETFDNGEEKWLINTLNDFAPPKPANLPLSRPNESELVETINGHIEGHPNYVTPIVQSLVEAYQTYGEKSPEMEAAVAAFRELYTPSDFFKSNVEISTQNELDLQIVSGMASKEEEKALLQENGMHIINKNQPYHTSLRYPSLNEWD